VSVLPAVANSLILMADELIRQVNAKFPPPLLQAFIGSLLSEIDRKTLAQVIEGARQLAQDLSPAFRETLDAPEHKLAAGAKE